MIKRFSSLALAAVLALALSAPATAATILVTSDSGQGYGTVTGTASGASFTSTTSVLNPTALNIINGSNLPLLPVYSLSLNETVTAFTQVIVAGQTIDVITAGTGSKTITSNGISVTLNFSLTSGIAQSGHFNTDATITSVTGSAAVGGPPPVGSPFYNFYGLLHAPMSVGLDKVGSDMTAVLGHAGNTITQVNLSLSEGQAVPEPSSMALLGIGMTGFLAFRRLFKRTANA